MLAPLPCGLRRTVQEDQVWGQILLHTQGGYFKKEVEAQH